MLTPRFLLPLLVTYLFLSSCAPTPQTPAPATPAPSESQLRAIQQAALTQEGFADNLAADPRGVLQKQGVQLPAGENVKVMEMGSSLYLVLDDRNLATFHPNLTQNSGEGELQQQMAAIKAKAAKDNTFKQQLLTQAATTLKKEGVDADLAPLFQVIDYQPATSMILLPSGIADISRGTPEDEAAIDNAFGPISASLRPVLQKILAGLGKNPDEATQKAASVRLASASSLICNSGFKQDTFACDKAKGSSSEFWLAGIRKFISP